MLMFEFPMSMSIICACLYKQNVRNLPKTYVVLKYVRLLGQNGQFFKFVFKYHNNVEGINFLHAFSSGVKPVEFY